VLLAGEQQVHVRHALRTQRRDDGLGLGRRDDCVLVALEDRQRGVESVDVVDR
jgi:hypothetical protein